MLSDALGRLGIAPGHDSGPGTVYCTPTTGRLGRRIAARQRDPLRLNADVGHSAGSVGGVLAACVQLVAEDGGIVAREAVEDAGDLAPHVRALADRRCVDIARPGLLPAQ